MTRLVEDLRYGMGLLLHGPTFMLVGFVTLRLGIGTLCSKEQVAPAHHQLE